jgi:uncharacterized protein
LLTAKTFQRLASNPDSLRDIVRASSSELTIIDEVQKLPSLLDAVQQIIFESKGKHRFLLTGSSARKLKRQGVNLLGGRAQEINMFPLLLSELESDRAEDFLVLGTLPSVVTAPDKRLALESYVSVYLDQEIRAEGLSRSLEYFSRFLEIAALEVGNQISYRGLSSDVGRSEKTVAQWFGLLQDTLVGHLVPCFSKTVKRKPVTSPKFYFFDCGLGNALLGRFNFELSTPEASVSLENLVFTHLKAWASYGPIGREVFYWRTENKIEVDFIVTRDKKPELAIEVKSTSRPKKEHFDGLKAFAEEYPNCQKILLCFVQERELTQDGIRIEPVGQFLKKGWAEFCL